MQERERDLGRRITVSEFAEWLNQGQPVVSNWMSGRHAPSYEKAVQMAPIIGYDIFDALNFARPDKRLAEINEVYDLVPDEKRDELLTVVLEWAEAEGYSVGIKKRDQGSASRSDPEK